MQLFDLQYHHNTFVYCKIRIIPYSVLH